MIHVRSVLYSNDYIQIYYYGCFFLLSFVFSIFILKDAFKSLFKAQVYIIFSSFFGIILGKIFYYVFFSVNPLIISLKSGLSSHGVLTGLFISSYLISAIYKESSNKLLNSFLVSSTLSGSLIRLGNFFNSEKYGDILSESLRITLSNHNLIAYQGYLRHPVQLYEFFIFFIAGILFIVNEFHKRFDDIYLYICIFIFLVRIFIFIIFCQFCNNIENLFNYVYFLIFLSIAILKKFI